MEDEPDFNNPFRGLGMVIYLAILLPFIPVHYIVRCILIGFYMVFGGWWARYLYKKGERKSETVAWGFLLEFIGVVGLWAVITYKDAIAF